ncbi:hypothetical protein ABZP36_031263 [Zizania latifolia]
MEKRAEGYQTIANATPLAAYFACLLAGTGTYEEEGEESMSTAVTCLFWEKTEKKRIYRTGTGSCAEEGLEQNFQALLLRSGLCSKITKIYVERSQYMSGYYGGHADVYIPHGEDLYLYDVNSLYLFAMQSFDMPGGKPVWHNNLGDKNSNLELEDMFGFMKALVICPNDIDKPFLPYQREDNTLIFPTDNADLREEIAKLEKTTLDHKGSSEKKNHKKEKTAEPKKKKMKRKKNHTKEETAEPEKKKNHKKEETAEPEKKKKKKTKKA